MLTLFSSYNFGVITGLLLMPSFQSDMSTDNDSTSSALISALMAGAVIGAIFSGPLADTIGRKALMALGITIFIFGNVLQVGADDIDMMYGGRGVTGHNIHGDQSELAPKHMRGRLISIQQFAIALGICLSYWLDYLFVNVNGSTGWRLALGLQLIPAVICLMGLILFIPQSPRHSIDKQRPEEALKTLSKIRGDGTINHNDVLMEYSEMKQNITFEHKLFHDHKYRRLFYPGPENNRRRLLLGMSVQIFQQLTGVNALLVFAPQIFRATGLPGRDAALFANGISGSINLLATIPAMIFGSLGWIYPAELYSQGVRAKALGISTASNWLFTFAVLQVTPIMLQNIHWKTYLLFSIMCLIIAVVVHSYFPETNGKSLEEVDLIFSCGFNYYDVDVHHPQTAAAALAQMEKVQKKNKDIYQFPFTPEQTILSQHPRSHVPTNHIASQSSCIQSV
ncbi:hypothetical protein BDB01DRAFT_848617 [Pilobolus umbonatus]|nr:hypothetical protein BDB01DRAFT_848617 [Pilobolus umbonatus]